MVSSSPMHDNGRRTSKKICNWLNNARHSAVMGDAMQVLKLNDGFRSAAYPWRRVRPIQPASTTIGLQSRKSLAKFIKYDASLPDFRSGSASSRESHILLRLSSAVSVRYNTENSEFIVRQEADTCTDVAIFSDCTEQSVGEVHSHSASTILAYSFALSV